MAAQQAQSVLTALSCCRTLREMRKQLEQAADWRSELERMKTAAVVGCLHVESKTLRNALSRIPATILTQVLVSLSSTTCCSVKPCWQLCMLAVASARQGVLHCC